MGLFDYPGLIVKVNLESGKDGSLFGGCGGFGILGNKKIESLIGYTYGKKLMVFYLISPLLHI